MGALTGNRNKRDAEFRYSSPSGVDYNPLHVAKKLKSSSSSSPLIAPTETSRRLRQYPPPTPIVREVHAPCRIFSGFTGSSKRLIGGYSGIVEQKSDFAGDNGRNDLDWKYNQAKKSAIGTCKFVVFEEEGEGEEEGEVEVIDVDNDETVKAVSRSSSVEEVEMVKDGIAHIHRSGEAQEIAAKYWELDQKTPSTSSEVVSELTNGKMLESLSMNRWSDAMDVDFGFPLHKKLLNQSAERDPKLRRIQFEIQLEEARRSRHQQLHPAKKKEDVNDPFRPLTDDEHEMVDNALSYSNRRKAFVNHENSNITITGEVLQCLRPKAWLNDEVINLYLELLKERETRDPQKYLKCHFFNSFFYKKLISGRTGYDYKSVRRWTTQKKLGYGLLECDKIFVPIHKEIHWCLAVINKKEEKFQYLDSLGGVDKKVMKMLAMYITDEVKDKTGKNIDVSCWKQEFVTDLPNQENGYDCGMFMIKYADFYSRDIGLCFNQEHMPYFRLRTAKEILKLRAD
ncbi:hypothetical protein LXL04_029168 [Taraxacum kok-saghyz]